MIKGLVVLIGGIFLGALAVELVRKKYPKGLDRSYRRIREISSDAGKSFMEGYQNAAPSKETAGVSV